MPARSNLKGLGVLVTRPAHQAGPLCDRILATGGQPVRFPLLSIHDTGDSATVRTLLRRLREYHIAIFISPNAVQFGLDAIERHGGLPDDLKLAAVGRGTARELEQRLGRGPDLVPQEHFDSEGLLALPGLQQVTGRRILIFRGNGGRELLANRLTERGAEVDYAEVYRREATDAGAAEADWLNRSDIITITSCESLRNLVASTEPKERSKLLDKPLVVVSERAIQLANELGFHQPPRLAKRAADDAIMEAVLDWAAEIITPE